jgi:hypothetical protein
MSKLNLSQYRNAMFANRGTDINDALEYALRMTAGNPEGLTAVYVVLNTVINAVEADARVATRAAADVATGLAIIAAVRDWLTENAGDIVADWCSENAGDMVSEWCGDNHDVEDWMNDNASDTIEIWMNHNAKDNVADIVNEKVDSMTFTISAK